MAEGGEDSLIEIDLDEVEGLERNELIAAFTSHGIRYKPKDSLATMKKKLRKAITEGQQVRTSQFSTPMGNPNAHAATVTASPDPIQTFLSYLREKDEADRARQAEAEERRRREQEEAEERRRREQEEAEERREERRAEVEERRRRDDQARQEATLAAILARLPGVQIGAGNGAGNAQAAAGNGGGNAAANFHAGAGNGNANVDKVRATARPPTQMTKAIGLKSFNRWLPTWKNYASLLILGAKHANSKSPPSFHIAMETS